MAAQGTVDLSVTREEVLNCAIFAWYEKFKSVTFESVFIPLSPDFVAYLNKDGVILPHGCPLPSHIKSKVSDSESDSEEEKVDWSDSDSDHSEDDKEPYFPELVEKIQSAIASLGGCVVPKLNWSTPRDATWMLPGNSLGCTTVGEVILLLKSSDFVAHDLSRVFEYCGDEVALAGQPSITYTLCLRRWVDFHPSAEFRCFVRDNNLFAISQREYTSCYDFLVTHKDSIRQAIAAFFHRCICRKFCSSNYVFDVCRLKEDDIRLVDFNPFCPMTDGLLFSWNELVKGTICTDGEAPVIRVVEGKPGVQPHDLHTSRLPKDFVDLSTGADITKFVDFVKMNKLDKDSGSDSDSS